MILPKQKWTAYVEKDGDDFILPLPEDLLNQLDWKAGDTLEWDVRPDGAIVLSRKRTLWGRFKEWLSWRI